MTGSVLKTLCGDMKYRSSFLLIALLGLLLSACVPMRVNRSPGVSGTVVDAKTHAPLAGANIEVWQNWVSSYAAERTTNAPSVKSDNEGHFVLPPLRGWAYDVGTAAGPALGGLVVRHDGYEPAFIRFGARSTTNIGIIRLVPTITR